MTWSLDLNIYICCIIRVIIMSPKKSVMISETSIGIIKYLRMNLMPFLSFFSILWLIFEVFEESSDWVCEDGRILSFSDGLPCIFRLMDKESSVISSCWSVLCIGNWRDSLDDLCYNYCVSIYNERSGMDTLAGNGVCTVLSTCLSSSSPYWVFYASGFSHINL